MSHLNKGLQTEAKPLSVGGCKGTQKNAKTKSMAQTRTRKLVKCFGVLARLLCQWALMLKHLDIALPPVPSTILRLRHPLFAARYPLLF